MASGETQLQGVERSLQQRVAAVVAAGDFGAPELGWTATSSIIREACGQFSDESAVLGCPPGLVAACTGGSRCFTLVGYHVRPFRCWKKPDNALLHAAQTTDAIQHLQAMKDSTDLIRDASQLRTKLSAFSGVALPHECASKNVILRACKQLVSNVTR